MFKKKKNDYNSTYEENVLTAPLYHQINTRMSNRKDATASIFNMLYIICIIINITRIDIMCLMLCALICIQHIINVNIENKASYEKERYNPFDSSNKDLSRIIKHATKKDLIDKDHVTQVINNICNTRNAHVEIELIHRQCRLEQQKINNEMLQQRKNDIIESRNNKRNNNKEIIDVKHSIVKEQNNNVNTNTNEKNTAIKYSIEYGDIGIELKDNGILYKTIKYDDIKNVDLNTDMDIIASETINAYYIEGNKVYNIIYDEEICIEVTK